jgi:hypothetical protein
MDILDGMYILSVLRFYRSIKDLRFKDKILRNILNENKN